MIIKDKKAQVRFIVGIFVILFGLLGSLFLGLGIMFNNTQVIYIGGVIMAGVPFALALISKYLT